MATWETCKGGQLAGVREEAPGWPPNQVGPFGRIQPLALPLLLLGQHPGLLLALSKLLLLFLPTGAPPGRRCGCFYLGCVWAAKRVHGGRETLTSSTREMRRRRVCQGERRTHVASRNPHGGQRKASGAAQPALGTAELPSPAGSIALQQPLLLPATPFLLLRGNPEPPAPSLPPLPLQLWATTAAGDSQGPGNRPLRAEIHDILLHPILF